MLTIDERRKILLGQLNAIEKNITYLYREYKELETKCKQLEDENKELKMDNEDLRAEIQGKG